jgi:hypothetical protein
LISDCIGQKRWNVNRWIEKYGFARVVVRGDQEKGFCDDTNNVVIEYLG